MLSRRNLFHQVEGSCSSRGELLSISCDHEEADTRMIILAIEARDRGYDTLMVNCSNTDVLLLLVKFVTGAQSHVWMISGSSLRQKCYSVNEISTKLSVGMKNTVRKKRCPS